MESDKEFLTNNNIDIRLKLIDGVWNIKVMLEDVLILEENTLYPILNNPILYNKFISKVKSALREYKINIVLQ